MCRVWVRSVNIVISRCSLEVHMNFIECTSPPSNFAHSSAEGCSYVNRVGCIFPKTLLLTCCSIPHQKAIFGSAHFGPVRLDTSACNGYWLSQLFPMNHVTCVIRQQILKIQGKPLSWRWPVSSWPISMRICAPTILWSPLRIPLIRRFADVCRIWKQQVGICRDSWVAWKDHAVRRYFAQVTWWKAKGTSLRTILADIGRANYLLRFSTPVLS